MSWEMVAGQLASRPTLRGGSKWEALRAVKKGRPVVHAESVQLDRVIQAARVCISLLLR